MKSLRKHLLRVALVSIVLAGFFVAPAYSYTKIPDKALEKIATFKLAHSNSHQGGVVTPKYFVYLDCINHCMGGGEAVIVSRSNCELVKKVKLHKDRLSGPSYKWNSNYVTLINVGHRKGCIHLNGKKSSYTSSGCFEPVNQSYLGPSGGSSQGASTNFNNHIFRVAGLNTPTGVAVFTYSGSRVGEFRIAEKFGEPENISIDGKTGEAYIDFDRKKSGSRYAIFYKINYKKLQNYTGKHGKSNPVKCKAIGKSSGGNTSGEKSGGGASGTVGGGNHNDPYIQPDSPGYTGSISTTTFGDIQDDGEGCGVFMVLNLIVEILTYGIAIAATIGITISGITYLTAKGDPAQVNKSKRRLFEIIIGLTMYAVLWFILNFFLPGGVLNTSTQCKEATETTSMFDTKPVSVHYDEKEVASTAAKAKTKKENAAVRKKIAATATKFAWPYKKWSKNRSLFDKAPPGYMTAFNATAGKWERKLCAARKNMCNSARLIGKSCSSYGTTVLRTAVPKLNKPYPKGPPTPSQDLYKWLVKQTQQPKEKRKWKRVSLRDVEPGDIDVQTKDGSGQHTAVVINGKGTKCTSAEAANGVCYGRAQANGKHSSYGRTHNFFRYLGT